MKLNQKLILYLFLTILLTACTSTKVGDNQALNKDILMQDQTQIQGNQNQLNQVQGLEQGQNAAQGAQAASPSGLTTFDQLQTEDIIVGTGAEAKAGNVVTVHYTGTLTNGQKFDSSLDRKQPFTFNLGAGQVIKGWDQGVVGMKVGGKRKLIIPASLAYGDQGAGNVIPPGATLVFEVELLDTR